MNGSRPNPDSLLKRAQSEQRGSTRGKLKIYLGMAAGVGKTFAMLSDALTEQKRGVKVLAGYIEPHGRAETEELAKQLPNISPRVLEYRGITLHEFDLDQALAQKPEIILVDELAHTNAPNSRHIKRYQDIEELCAKGINVFTTLNIQHIESLRDVISNITGVEVQETVPDSVLAQADEIELIDIPPDELLQRLEAGKIYKHEKVDTALRNFFRKGNLVALREIVLRHAADTVDAQLRSYRTLEGVDEIWATNPRVLVSVAPTKFAVRLVHAAIRLARNLKAPLVALTVETPRTRQASEIDRAHAERALASAARAEAEIIRVSGYDIVQEVIRVAKETNATIIVVGKPMRSKLREFIFGSIVDDLVRQSGKIDILVVQGSADEGGSLRTIPAAAQFSRSSVLQSVLWVVLATAVCFLAYPFFELSNLVMIYLLAVAWVASHHGRIESVIASILSVAAFDFFFVPPRWTFAVSDAQYAVTFAVMLVVALLISSLAYKLKAQSELALDRERRTRTLFEFNQKLSVCRSLEEAANVTAEMMRKYFGLESLLYWPEGVGELRALNRTEAQFESDHNEMAVAKWSSDRKIAAGKTTSTLPGSKGYYVPLEIAPERIPVWGIYPSNVELDARQTGAIDGLSHLLVGALGRINLEREATQAQFRMQQEELRNVLLSSVSHDLRTPLTAICGAASTLVDDPKLSEPSRQLALTISESSSRLTQMVRNVLDLSRLESGRLALNREWHALEEIVGAALRRTESLLKGLAIEVKIPADFPLLFVDGILFEQVFVNLLENVARHAEGASRVEISARADSEHARIEVGDNGTGLEAEIEKQVFEKLVRGKASQGFGLGLAICNTIISAHAGKISAVNRAEGGALFILELPVLEIPQGPEHD